MNHGNVGLKCQSFPHALKQTACPAHRCNKKTIYFCPGMPHLFCFFPLGFLFIYLYFLSPKPLQKRLKSITAFKRKPHATVFSIFKDFVVNFNIPQIYKGNNSKFKNKKKIWLESFSNGKINEQQELFVLIPWITHHKDKVHTACSRLQQKCQANIKLIALQVCYAPAICSACKHWFYCLWTCQYLFMYLHILSINWILMPTCFSKMRQI